jgi:myo-inositol-1(or 4)-monophosphatase
MIDVLKSIASEAGATLLKYYRKKLTLNYKTSHKDFYTIADIESQKLIKKNLTKALIKKGVKESDIGFIGEENLSTGADKKHLFVIDPLDGTSNFSFGLDIFTVSIGYFYKGQLTAGMIYRPTSKDFYWAEKNKGAYKNGQRLKIVYRPLNRCSLDATVSLKGKNYKRLFKSFQEIFPLVSAYHAMHCITVTQCLFAENVYQIIANGNVYVWDLAAIKLIAEEAGGIMIDFKGEPLEFDLENPTRGYEIITCHPKLKSELLPFFAF